MTSPRDVDELASDLIDGLLDEEAAEAARRDPAVAGRVAEMRAAREALRAVPPPDPARREDTVAAALRAADAPALGDPADGRLAAAADAGRPAPASGARPNAPQDAAAEPGTRPVAVPPEPHAPPDHGVPGAVPPDPGAAGGLDAHSPRPHAGPPPTAGVGGLVVSLGAGRRRRWADPRWLGAAAALVLVVMLGAVLAGQSGGDSEDTAATTAAGSQSNPEAGAGSDVGDGASEERDAASDEAAGDDSTTAFGGAAPDDVPDLSAESAPGGLVDLGAADSAPDLADLVRSALAGREGNGSAGDTRAVGAACSDPLPAADAGPLVLRGRATLAGQPVDVWVHDDGGTRRMVATDASCAVVANRIVPG